MIVYEITPQCIALRLFPCYYDILEAKYLAIPKGIAIETPSIKEVLKQGISGTFPNDNSDHWIALIASIRPGFRTSFGFSSFSETIVGSFDIFFSNQIFPFFMFSRFSRMYTTRLFKPAFSKQETELAFQNVKKSVRGNPVDIRRTYWFHVYKNVLKARYLFVLQNNNIPAPILVQLRKELTKSNIEMLNVRNAVFAAAAKSDQKHQLKNLFQAQTMVWFSDVDDTTSPNLLQDVGKIAQKYKTYLFMTGGMMEGDVITTETFNELKSLPPKAVLFAQLLGVLQHPASNLASILSRTPQLLTANLEQHVKQLNDKQ
jgi:large subunit ribosomal protein L10